MTDEDEPLGPAQGSGGVTGVGGSAGTGGSSAGAPQLTSDVVFRQDQVLEYHVTMTEADRLYLEEHGNDEAYVPATLVVRGGEVGELDLGKVGIRHKGAYSLHHCWDNFGGVRSYERECAKLSYKFDFHEYVESTRLFGLKRLNLHASSGDDTKFRELLGYGTFAEFGIVAPRIAPARVYVNGVFGGLFFAVENVDGRFTKYHFPQGGDGNLYKEVWPRAGLRDSHFIRALQTNEDDPDVSDMQGFAAAIAGSTEATFVKDMAPWIDIEQLLRYIAVDRASKNWDGIMAFYSPVTPHNFFFYRDDGAEPRFHLIPWDLDNVFWDFDPYMAPEQWLTTEPVPDFNQIPANCEPRPVWDVESSNGITPPGCDPLLRLLAATQWERLVAHGEELLGEVLTMPKLEAKLQSFETVLAPVVYDDPTIDADEWWQARQDFRRILERAIVDFRGFLAEGYHQEVIPMPLPEPSAEELSRQLPESGLIPGIVNNYEFIGGAAGTAPVGTSAVSSTGTTFTITWNTNDPIAGAADLLLGFQFGRRPGAWDEWLQLRVGVADEIEQDISGFEQISITMRADRTRHVRIQLDSPAYVDTFGGAWVGFGSDFTVGSQQSTVKLRFSKAYYPSWARAAWTGSMGWKTTDAEALAVVLRRFSGLTFSPGATTDSAGEMVSATESGYLHIDNIYFQ